MSEAPVPAMKPETNLKRLSAFPASIGSFSEDMSLYFDQREKLYHYPNLEGFHAILNSGDMRAGVSESETPYRG